MKSSLEDRIWLTKGRRRFLSQLIGYINEEPIFENKDEFVIRNNIPIPGAQRNQSKTPETYNLVVSKFIPYIEEILDDGYYFEDDQKALNIIREYIMMENYPFHNFKSYLNGKNK